MFVILIRSVLLKCYFPSGLQIGSDFPCISHMSINEVPKHQWSKHTLSVLYSIYPVSSECYKTKSVFQVNLSTPIQCLQILYLTVPILNSNVADPDNF
jgi:hypothetical protein